MHSMEWEGSYDGNFATHDHVSYLALNPRNKISLVAKKRLQKR